ncbi:Thioredoxin M5 [Nymphaea thermarum]|nr:Thioredoxin M5 [Nymphaea thermarum]
MAMNSPLSLSSPVRRPLSCRLLSSPLLCRRMVGGGRSVSFARQSAPSGLFVSDLVTKNCRFMSQKCKSGRIVCEAQATAVTESTWSAAVLENDLPVLVEFWAPWCGPCRMIQPIIDEVAKQYVGKLKCFKLNTDDSPQIATDYGVRSIPTVLLFRNGEKKESVIGAVPKSVLVKIIDKYLSS